MTGFVCRKQVVLLLVDLAKRAFWRHPRGIREASERYSRGIREAFLASFDGKNCKKDV